MGIPVHLMPPVEERVKKWLLPIEECSWSEDDVPLGQRGVRFGWLYDFLGGTWENVNAYVGRIWDQFRSQQNASMYGPWDVPWPDHPEYPEDLAENLRTTRQLVSNLIVPVTNSILAPLYARVPPAHRGRPSIFLSHTWDSNAFAGGHGSLDIVLDHNRDSFVWVDIASYNQNSVKSETIAADMRSIISDIGKVAFILTTEPFFTRSWCLWEVVCGHGTGAEVTIYDQILRIQKKYWSSEAGQMPQKFRSVLDLSASQESDREQILNLLISTFGSIEQADEYVRNLLRP